VLTLSGRNGEYGGPVRVARELCSELNSRGQSTHIFSGAIAGSEPIARAGLLESFVIVKPVSKRYSVSSYWNWKVISSLNQLIKKSEIVHIHFARDLISFVAAALSILANKPFVAQTHGMVIPDERRFTKILDFCLTKPLINRAHANLVLNANEEEKMMALGVKSEIVILSNGISISNSREKPRSKTKIVIFCSRLNKRKGIEKFIQLADISKELGFKFEIYGPDGGELDFITNQIREKKLDKIIEYGGSLSIDQVQEVLAKSDLLILPSKDEPFPMIVLESLAMGTPVMIDQSCGIETSIRAIDKNFVVNSSDIEEMQVKMRKILLKYEEKEAQKRLVDNANKCFSISNVCDDYLRVVGIFLK
jgi:glycosyltransferase involved in cell wall biosynthesis